MTAPPARPRTVDAAFWCWVLAALLLIVGGLLTAGVHQLPLAYRGAGVVAVLAGAGTAFLAGRTRAGDARFRRAAVALSLAVVVLVALVSLFGVVHVLTLLAAIPLIIATLLISRPSAAAWFEAEGVR